MTAWSGHQINLVNPIQRQDITQNYKKNYRLAQNYLKGLFTVGCYDALKNVV